MDSGKRRHNSTSSIYVQSTISSPNTQEIIKSVSTILQCLMIQSIQESGNTPDTVPIEAQFQLFDERHYYNLHHKHPSRDPYAMDLSADAAADDNMREAMARRPTPQVPEIYAFLKSIFDLARFSPECNTISLILINRLLTFTNMSFTQYNWRPLMLSSLLVSQKIWDDSCLANVDFPVLWGVACPAAKQALDVKAVNHMEAKYLELLQFNVYVSSGLYARYYFELRTLLESSHPSAANMMRPLTKAQGDRLEARSAEKADYFERSHESKSKSFQNDFRGSSSRTVLS